MSPLERGTEALGQREANESATQFREHDEQMPGISSFPVQIVVLTSLRSSQATLEALLRASFASHQRFGASVGIKNEIDEASKQLRSRNYWRGLDQSLSDIATLSDELAALGLTDARLVGWATEYDAALVGAREVVRGMRNVANAGDARLAASNVQTHVDTMSDRMRDIVRTCEREAEKVIDGMRTNLERIFALIESERERIEREYRQQTSPPEHGTYGSPGADAGRGQRLSDPSRFRESSDDRVNQSSREHPQRR